MSTDLEKLTHELLELPLPVRGELALRLIRSLEEDEAETPDAQQRWLEAARRRAAEVDDGKATCIPAEEVFRKLREEVG